MPLLPCGGACVWAQAGEPRGQGGERVCPSKPGVAVSSLIGFRDGTCPYRRGVSDSIHGHTPFATDLSGANTPFVRKVCYPLRVGEKEDF